MVALTAEERAVGPCGGCSLPIRALAQNVPLSGGLPETRLGLSRANISRAAPVLRA